MTNTWFPYQQPYISLVLWLAGQYSDSSETGSDESRSYWFVCMVTSCLAFVYILQTHMVYSRRYVSLLVFLSRWVQPQPRYVTL